MITSKYVYLLLAALFFSPPLIHSQEAMGTNGSPTSSYAFKDSPEGLQQLLQDALIAARAGNRTRLMSIIAEMEIPNYDVWFTETFGEEKGESWAGPYGRDLRQNEEDMQQSFLQCAKQDGEISTRKVNDAPEPGEGLEWGLVKSLQRPVDIFSAGWKPRKTTRNTKVDPIGYFMFVDGKFRWDSTIRFINLQSLPAPVSEGPPASTNEQSADESNNSSGSVGGGSPFHPGAGGVGYPACAYCPGPEYPKQAKAEHAEGTVLLRAVIQPSGRATDIDVVKSPRPDLAEAAITVVRTWRFKPAVGPKGVPVPVILPIEVAFALAR